MLRFNSAAFTLDASRRKLFAWLARLIMLIGFAFSHTAIAQNALPGGATDQPIMQQLLQSIAQNDYAGFVSQGTPAFASLDESQFTQVAQTVAPRLQKGYTVQHLGNLQQQGLDISVWKVSFKDQGDDLLATLNVQNGRVGGFFLR
ncbi:hypothetical protein VRY85_12875 [Achromobacter sp. F4_2707]|uniref:hypothetical protein n=1 Tax=Achromobacter sp. F4_2707 TaxID=3114286 RepID=UPI0039C6CEB0